VLSTGDTEEQMEFPGKNVGMLRPGACGADNLGTFCLESQTNEGGESGERTELCKKIGDEMDKM
jgi:hypothetical protein